MLLDFDGTTFNTDHIVAVRRSGLNSHESIIFTVGQSAVDGGFLVRVSYEKIIKKLKDIRLGHLFEIAELLDNGYDDDDEDDEEEIEGSPAPEGGNRSGD